MRRAAIAIAMVALSGGLARAQRTGVQAAQEDTARCQRLFDDGELAKAEAACVEALKKDAGYVDAWKIYLATLFVAHKEEKAIAEAERAESTLGIRDASVLAFHGAAIYQLASRPAVDPKTQQPNKWAKQHAKALPYLERAASLDSSLFVAQAPLCTYWTLEPQYMDRSASACNAALKAQPNNADVLDSLAWIHFNHRRYVDAQTMAEQVLRAIKPKDSGTRGRDAQIEIKAKTVIGLSQAERGDCSSARRTLEPLQKLALRGAWLVDRGLTLCAQTQQEADRYGLEYMRLQQTDPKGPLARALAYRTIANKRRPADPALLGGALSDLAKAKPMAQSRGNRDVLKDITRQRAEILSQLGRYVEAEDEWKPIYEEEGPTNVDAVMGYGVASRKAGHLKVATRVFEAGSKKNPDHAGIKFELGRTLVEAGDLAVGIKDMEAALATDEKDLTRRTELVNVLTREGVKLATKGQKPKEAELLLEKAVKYDPNSVIANRNLGLARLQQRRYAEALGPLQVWQRKMGKDRDSNLILGRVLAGIGKRDEAIRAYEQARESATRSGVALAMAEVLIELGPLYTQAGKHADAVAALETARDNIQATLNLPSNAKGAAGAIAEAKILEAVVRRNRALAYLARGYDFVQKKNAEAGVADLQKALEDPKALEVKERTNATCALAFGYLGANKAAQAVPSFQQAQKAGGCDFKAPYDKLGLDYWIAYARYREGTPAGLNDALRVFARTAPKATGEMADKFKEMTFSAYLKLTAEEYARGNLGGAMTALKNAQKAATGVKDEVRKRDLQHNLAVLDLASGKTAQAKQQLEQLGARPPEALVNLGLIYERQGDIQRALQLWQQSGRGGKVREWIDATRRFLGAGPAGAGGGQP